MAFQKVPITCSYCSRPLGNIKMDTKHVRAMTKILFACIECQEKGARYG